MKKAKNLKSIVLIIIFSLLIIFVFGRVPLSRVIFGPPSMHQFYGKVSLENGTGVKDGIIVYAVVNKIIVEQTMTLNGKYGYQPLFIIEDVLEGSLIEFYLDDSANNVKVAEYVFKNLELTELDLYFDICGDGFCASNRQESCLSCSADCGVCPSEAGDGGGGGGGGGGVTGEVTETQPTIPVMPETEEPEKEQEENKETGRTGITGGAISDIEKPSTLMFVLVLIVLVVSLIVLIAVLIKGGKEK